LILGFELIIIVLLVILGAAFGSFFNVIIYRLPRKESIVLPSSHCPNCNKPIPFWLNIPILSYLLLGGKCRYCGEKIHWHYFLVELITPLVFLALYFRISSLEMLIFLKYAVFFGFGICIFFIDVFHQLILDVLSYPLIVLGLLISLIPNMDVSFKNSLIGGLVCFLFFYVLSLAYYGLKKKDGMGGGDIKLITAIGTFFGFPDALFIIVFASVLAVIVIPIIQKNLRKYFPFGPFIIAAALLHVLVGYQIMNAYLNLISFI
jgi:leader peptidase (prepilin peptidase) / N-methyltransferase